MEEEEGGEEIEKKGTWGEKHCLLVWLTACFCYVLSMVFHITIQVMLYMMYIIYPNWDLINVVFIVLFTYCPIKLIVLFYLQDSVTSISSIL